MTEIQKAEALLNEGKLKEAEKRFLKIAKKEPGNQRVFNTLGVIAFQQGDVLTAIARFSQALQIDPVYRTSLINMSMVLRATDRLEEIMELLEQYLRQHPNDSDIANLYTEVRRERIKPVAHAGMAQGLYETVGVLLITRNHLPALRKNLPQLLANALIPIELTIVDNHSTDGTPRWLEGIGKIMPVKHEVILNRTDEGMLTPTDEFYKSSSCRFLIRVAPDGSFHPGWLMEYYHKCAGLASQNQKTWLARNAEAVHQSLGLNDKSHLDNRRQYAMFYEEQGRDISVTRMGQDRMFHPDGNPRLNYVADCAQGNCLDIGCQYGAYSIWLAKQGHNVCAVDVSLAYLREAQYRIDTQPAEVQDRLRLFQSWAENLPFVKESFDTVLLAEILEHVLEPAETMAEALRVLKPDGVLYLSMPGYSDNTLEHVREFDEPAIMNLLRHFAGQLDLSSLQWYYRQPNDHYMLALHKKVKTTDVQAEPATVSAGA